MHGCRVSRIAVFALVLAALAVHFDLPRLHLAFRIGDTLNAVRVMDAVQHHRMARLVEGLDDDELARALEDGQESLEWIVHTPVLSAIAAPRFRLPSADAHTPQPRIEIAEALPLPLPGIVARLLESALPPPRGEAPLGPPRSAEPSADLTGLNARAPPLALR